MITVIAILFIGFFLYIVVKKNRRKEKISPHKSIEKESEKYDYNNVNQPFAETNKVEYVKKTNIVETNKTIDYNPFIDYNPLHITKAENYYDKLLDSKEWKEKRQLIIIRDFYRCRYCGSEQNLQVHHKYYNKYPNGKKVLPWDYPNDALITLCDSCHKRIHETKKIKTYFRKYGESYLNV